MAANTFKLIEELEKTAAALEELARETEKVASLGQNPVGDFLAGMVKQIELGQK